MTIPATPTKLRNGSWGAKVTGRSVQVGDVVTITTRGGKSWEATVERVVWSGDDVSILATKSVPKTQSRQTNRPIKGVDYCGYPCPVTRQRCTPSNPCHDCQ